MKDLKAKVLCGQTIWFINTKTNDLVLVHKSLLNLFDDDHDDD